MHPNSKLIDTFYSCFQQLDGDGMADCYHSGIQFSDPAFPDLKGEEVGMMWRMLCSQAQGFELSYDHIVADEASGKADWNARYDFSMTGRRVYNKIKAEFKFRDGKIIEHKDTFNFWKWSAMALGPTGSLLGWTPLVKNKVRRQAAKNLQKFIRSQSR